MFLLNWYREYLDIKNTQAEKKKELQYCEACETLKLQLAVSNDERKMLIEKLTAKPEPVHERTAPEQIVMQPLRPDARWSVRRQMLEAEDRQTAKALKNNESINGPRSVNKPASKDLTAAEIERELGVENG